MTIGGWIFMVLSVSLVVGLATFCFYRVLTTTTRPPRADVQSSPLGQPAEPQRPRKQTSG
ncbi:MAG: hypothetical protein NZ578_09060 [Candidatus Binatia bacterium]|nr:hypothetical protein [Candidatus Binatia bacterium]